MADDIDCILLDDYVPCVPFEERQLVKLEPTEEEKPKRVRSKRKFDPVDAASGANWLERYMPDRWYDRRGPCPPMPTHDECLLRESTSQMCPSCSTFVTDTIGHVMCQLEHIVQRSKVATHTLETVFGERGEEFENGTFVPKLVNVREPVAVNPTLATLISENWLFREIEVNRDMLMRVVSILSNISASAAATVDPTFPSADDRVGRHANAEGRVSTIPVAAPPLCVQPPPEVVDIKPLEEVLPATLVEAERIFGQDKSVPVDKFCSTLDAELVSLGVACSCQKISGVTHISFDGRETKILYLLLHGKLGIMCRDNTVVFCYCINAKQQTLLDSTVVKIMKNCKIKCEEEEALSTSSSEDSESSELDDE